MVNPILIPFKAEHLLEFSSRDYLFREAYDEMIEKETKGPAYTAMINGEIICCAGIIIQRKGFGSAWAVFGEKASSYPIFITRTIRNVIRDTFRIFKLHRIELVALAHIERNQKWAELLGFSRENGIARKFGYHKEDVIRYEFVDDRMINE